MVECVSLVGDRGRFECVGEAWDVYERDRYNRREGYVLFLLYMAPAWFVHIGECQGIFFF